MGLMVLVATGVEERTQIFFDKEFRWWIFCATGKQNLAFTSCKMKSSEYIDVLKLCLIPFKNKYRRKKFVFQQDNASIHTNSETKAISVKLKKSSKCGGLLAVQI